MMLQDKVAVIYGAGGAIGGAVARAFASEGAKGFSPAPPGLVLTKMDSNATPHSRAVG
jgi:NAD(P)-dependent dehydrogenase (short-subunit alcohol dehydrogenase family)